MQTKTIYISPAETRTFSVGEIVDTYIGTVKLPVEIVSFDGDLFHFRYTDYPKVHSVIGSVFAQFLTPGYRGVETLNGGW